jgi:hypothetical protein|tara:strand:- start:364 stop:597 length:234 start_codon:yes stop_codon:yes gene_type:complete
MDKLDKAIRRICDNWPSEPCWIFTSPDGSTVYRSMRTDVCPEEFKNDKGAPNKQLHSVDGIVVSKDEDYGNKENIAW